LRSLALSVERVIEKCLGGLIAEALGRQWRHVRDNRARVLS
jgi:hypothetical protein